MNILRRLCLSVCAALLFFSLFGLAWGTVGNATIRSRDTIGEWLDDSDFYNKIVDQVLENAREQTKDQTQAIPADDLQVQTIARDALNPDFLKENVEEVLTSTYDWLDGESSRISFEVDLTDAKQRLITGLGEYATTRARNLPVCTAAQLRELGSFNALSAPCLPPGMTPEAAGAQAQNELASNSGFLENVQITDSNVLTDEAGKRIEEKLGFVSFIYRLAGVLPYVFGALALGAVGAIIFLSPTRRQGVRRSGAVFLSTGITLGLTYLLFSKSSEWISRSLRTSDDATSTVEALTSNLVQVIVNDVNRVLVWFVFIFTVIGAGCVLLATLYKRPTPKNLRQSTDPEPPIDDSPKIDPARKPTDPADKKDPDTSQKIQP